PLVNPLGQPQQRQQAMMVIGTLSRKNARHDTWSTNHPPAYGPRLVKSVSMPTQSPIALALSVARNAPLSNASLVGVINAPPAPCSSYPYLSGGDTYQAPPEMIVAWIRQTMTTRWKANPLGKNRQVRTQKAAHQRRWPTESRCDNCGRWS